MGRIKYRMEDLMMKNPKYILNIDRDGSPFVEVRKKRGNPCRYCDEKRNALWLISSNSKREYTLKRDCLCFRCSMANTENYRLIALINDDGAVHVLKYNPFSIDLSDDEFMTPDLWAAITLMKDDRLQTRLKTMITEGILEGK